MDRRQLVLSGLSAAVGADGAGHAAVTDRGEPADPATKGAAH